MFDFVVQGAAIKFHVSPAVQHNSRLTISTQSQPSATGFSAVKGKGTLFRHLAVDIQEIAKGKNDSASGATEIVVEGEEEEEEILPPLPELPE